jgi:hypothetical protein
MERRERDFTDAEWQRLPGLFYDSELGPAANSSDYRCEHVGHNSIGVALFAVYHRLPTAAKESAQ